ncbi:MAG: hypothetical protein WCA20_12690 [Candidatus Sulfotelmatobacter sp.]
MAVDGAGDVFIADSGNNRVVEVQYVAAGGLNGSNCNGAYTGTYKGNLTVSKGQVCIFTNGGVTGNLTQNGGTVVPENSSFVKGNLQIDGSLSIININSNSTVGNDLQITRSPAPTASRSVRESALRGTCRFKTFPSVRAQIRSAAPT